ncbi:hypothetical protein [Promicromonospora sp. NPDC050249]|uniref:hypothetical protein n=1 Tax=Promicromonospora sp. NPDC050249 TaxID=3154743 RepID=UPI00340FF1D4
MRRLKSALIVATLVATSLVGVVAPAQASTAVPTKVGTNDRDLYDSYRAPNGAFYEFGAYFAPPRSNVEADGDVWISFDMRIHSNRKISGLALDWADFGPSTDYFVSKYDMRGRTVAKSTDGKRVVLRYTVKISKTDVEIFELGYGKNWYLGDPSVSLFSGGEFLYHWRTETGHPWETEKFWVTAKF